MLLKTVKLKNFRCFTEVEVELSDTTVLIGENNTGKTSFLEAIRLAISRTVSRRDAGLEDYDHHLSSASVQPDEAGELSITLDFVIPDDTAADIVQALGDLQVFGDDGVGHIILRLKRSFEPTLKDFVSDWNFLDCSGDSLGPKTKRPQLLLTFLRLTPVFYLTALRDSAKEFTNRSPFWAPFLRYSDIPGDVREKLQKELDSLNHQVLESLPSLEEARNHLARVTSVVTSSTSGTVNIDALPGRISDLLSRTQINLTSPTGASLPLERHGSGTQSLAVIFLFEAFITTMLSKEYDEFSTPILTIEEPESHLHPCAVRSLWTTLQAIPGQKIIATHSGDLLANVPLKSIRRLCRKAKEVSIRSLGLTTLNNDELRKIEYHLQSSRGELLFARCWLLTEGESEYWLFNAASEIIGSSFDPLGIRVVNTRLSGIEPLIKVAKDFGIEWFFVGDGDGQGQKDEKVCKQYLDGKDAETRLYVFAQKNIEVLLCVEGYGHIYEKHVSQQKSGGITAEKGSIKYWEQVVKAAPEKGKPARIREVVSEMRLKGQIAIPQELKKIIKSVVTLAEGNHES